MQNLVKSYDYSEAINLKLEAEKCSFDMGNVWKCRNSDVGRLEKWSQQSGWPWCFILYL